MMTAILTAMKSGKPRGARTCLTLLMTAALAACGGGSGGGGDPVTPIVPPPVNPDQTFAISGAINGLTGAVRITDSFQTLDISSDSTFAFTHQYKKGETYAVTVDTGTTEQLCTVAHGAGLVLGNVENVSIDCLELRETNIRISKPAYYKAFNLLNLRSSYQSIPQLTGDTAKLVVAKNQFVTLYPADVPSQPIYLAFVKSFEETTVDALSTAVSLVLLSPSISTAIEERGGQFKNSADRFAALPDVIALADAIHKQADSGQLNLQTPSRDLLVLLDSAVTAAASDIVASDASAAKVSASSTGARAGKVQITPNGDSPAGLALSIQKIAPDAAGNNYQLQISNNQQRFIAVESLLLNAPLALAPGESQAQAFKSSDTNAIWTIYGPGAQAASLPVSASLKQAVIDTATQVYATPALAFVAGRLDEPGARLIACSDAETLTQLRDTTNAALQGDDALDKALRAPQYTAAYDAITAPLRANVISRLGELLECEFFRKGHWLDKHVNTATVQIGTMLKIAQAVNAPRPEGANVLIKAGLLAAGNVINTNQTEQQWQLSNELKLTVNRIVNGVAQPVTGTLVITEGDTLQLAASCTAPPGNLPVPCDVVWTSAQSSTQGGAYSEKLSSSGSINVAASDEDGATASTTVAVTVEALPPVTPEPPQSTSYWLLQDGSKTQRFDITIAEFLAPADGENVAQFHGYVSGNPGSAYISISLAPFGNPGSYVLDDIPGNSGLGFVFLDASTLQPGDPRWPWITKTTGPFAGQPVTGSAIYSVGTAGQKIVDFDFQVVPQQCSEPPCDKQQRVTGHIEAKP